jgi:putative oxidoreductase
MGIWRLLLRLTVGGLMIGHGTQKLFGWFGGDGIAGTARTFERLGLYPAREDAVAAGVAEAGGGALLVGGLETPLAATLLGGSMLTAIQRVHRTNGPWLKNGGYEYNGVLLALVLALVETGPGGLSLDAALGRLRRGPGWAAMAFGAASLGAYAVDTIAARRQPDPARIDVLREERSAA